MRQLNISMAVIVQAENYLLQLRNGGPEIGGAGLIGCFGGKIEASETPLQAICRELAEETSLKDLEPSSLQYVGELNVMSDHKLEPVQVHVEVFRLELDKDVSVAAHEGELVTLTLETILGSNTSLTPATRAYFKQFAEAA